MREVGRRGENGERERRGGKKEEGERGKKKWEGLVMVTARSRCAEERRKKGLVWGRRRR